MNTGFVKFTYSYQSDYKQKGYKKDVNVKQNRIRHEKYSIKWTYGYKSHLKGW
jgi:hypothetical protein